MRFNLKSHFSCTRLHSHKNLKVSLKKVSVYETSVYVTILEERIYRVERRVLVTFNSIVICANFNKIYFSKTIVICNFWINTVKDNKNWLLVFKNSAWRGFLALGPYGEIILRPKEKEPPWFRKKESWHIWIHHPCICLQEIEQTTRSKSNSSRIQVDSEFNRRHTFRFKIHESHFLRSYPLCWMTTLSSQPSAGKNVGARTHIHTKKSFIDIWSDTFWFVCIRQYKRDKLYFQLNVRANRHVKKKVLLTNYLSNFAYFSVHNSNMKKYKDTETEQQISSDCFRFCKGQSLPSSIRF